MYYTWHEYYKILYNYHNTNTTYVNKYYTGLECHPKCIEMVDCKLIPRFCGTNKIWRGETLLE